MNTESKGGILVKEFIVDITKQAGRETLKFFGNTGVKYTKRDAADVVTEADLVSNRMLVERIQAEYPTHALISEELGESGGTSEYRWIIDPLDGTRQFATHTPSFCTMVGLAKGGEMEIAAIYDPLHDELFFAEKGAGASLNGNPIHCSETSEWENSFGSCGPRQSKERAPFLARLLKAADTEKGSFWLSIFGSAGISMCYVACGRRDWGFSLSGSLWDTAAPSLILQEAGCEVSNLQGQLWKLGDGGLFFGNPHLQPKVVELARNH